MHLVVTDHALTVDGRLRLDAERAYDDRGGMLGPRPEAITVVNMEWPIKQRRSWFGRKMARTNFRVLTW